MSLFANKSDKKEFFWVAIVLGVGVICLAYFNFDFNAEIQSCSSWQIARVYAGVGCVAGLNDLPYHVEGTANLRNLQFFAGGSLPFSFGYEIATNRLLFAYFAALFVPFVGSILSAVIALNLFMWWGAGLMAFLLGKEVTKSSLVACLFAGFVISSVGFIATYLGVKAHLLSYTYFIIAVFFLERMGFFKPAASLTKTICGSLIIGIGVFANGLLLPLGIYAAIRCAFSRQFLRIALIGLIAALPLLSFKTGFVLFGGGGADRTDGVLISTFLNHMTMIFEYLTTGTAKPVTFIHRTITNPWEPFVWLSSVGTSLPLIFGWFGLLLAVIGLAPPWRQVHAVAVPSFIAVVLAVTGVQTYWPYWTFQGYTIYYVYVGFGLLMALGTVRIGDAVQEGIQRFLSSEAVHARYFSYATVCLLAMLWIGISSQHLVTHQYKPFFQFFNYYNLDYPDGWDFRIYNW